MGKSLRLGTNMEVLMFHINVHVKSFTSESVGKW